MHLAENILSAGPYCNQLSLPSQYDNESPMIVTRNQNEIEVEATVNSECKEQTYIWRYRHTSNEEFVVFPIEYYGNGMKLLLRVPSAYLSFDDYELQVCMSFFFFFSRLK